jgi:hypothetical protein
MLDMAATRTAPDPLIRPKFARFIWERDLTDREAADQLGRSRGWVQLLCLPFDDPRRRIPSAADVELIFDWSRGEIGPADWYPPRLSAPPAPANDLQSDDAEAAG